MSVNKEAYQKLVSELRSKNITLVAVSKTKSVEDIKELYDLGQKDFGENYVQELIEKHPLLPADIRWHFIGHLQANKVKFIAHFVQLIHGVDSLKLLKEINKQAEKNKRVIDCLLQVHIAQEETKFGFSEEELEGLFNTKSNELQELKNVRILGLMGMATLTDDNNKVKNEFSYLKSLFEKAKTKYPIFNSQFLILSMGMSADYKIAIQEGSNMVRIGSLLFGERQKKV
ncbi:MAG TPA: YggS family pyridoxal phosphate-dependent enzyme [Chitinophagaceae bacterium]|nr:YggS family pyridoxal phosphate-dependent enzyme [Chitinophagaceae bacterium]